jgi:hypothetical protein
VNKSYILCRLDLCRAGTCHVAEPLADEVSKTRAEAQPAAGWTSGAKVTSGATYICPGAGKWPMGNQVIILFTDVSHVIIVFYFD